MHDKLSHLSQDKIQQLIDRYYTGEKISDLISEYQIDCMPSRLVRFFPPKILDKQCPYCENQSLVSTYSSRSHQQESKPFCPVCGHVNHHYSNGKNMCRCNGCEQIKEDEVLARKAFLKESFYCKREDRTDVDVLKFEQVIYLAAFMREGITRRLQRN